MVKDFANSYSEVALLYPADGDLHEKIRRQHEGLPSWLQSKVSFQPLKLSDSREPTGTKGDLGECYRKGMGSSLT